MRYDRRHALGVGLLAGMASGFALTGCQSGGSAAPDGKTTLRYAWWGNPTINKQTNEAIDAYTKAHADVTIKGEPGDWSSYWDKLATQVAGHTAPDAIQMDISYISEYGSKGALLDLGKYVDTSKFTEGTVEPGTIDGKLMGVSVGINSLAFVANPKVFEAAGVKLPDDSTWTWDDYREIAAKITANSASGVTGSAGTFGDANLLQTWLRQHGKDLYTAAGALGFTADDLVPYFETMMAFEKAKAIPSPSAISEDSGRPTNQTLFGKGKQGLSLYWTNQYADLSKAVGTPLKLLRAPTTTGNADDRQAWYKDSSFLSASARTKDPEAVGTFINWWVNNPQGVNILRDSWGIPPNKDLAEQLELTGLSKKAATFLDDIAGELGQTPPTPPPGSGNVRDVIGRYATDVLFGRKAIPDAAKQLVSEAASGIQQAS